MSRASAIIKQLKAENEIHVRPIMIRLDQVQKERIQDECQKLGVSMNRLIIALIEEFISEIDSRNEKKKEK